MRSLGSILMLGLVAMLVGCGGGGGDGGPAAPPADPTEPNDPNAHSLGTLAGSDIAVNAATSSPSDIDFFRVTTTTPGALFVNLDWSSSSDLELAVSNASGIFVRHVDTASHPETCTMTAQGGGPLPAGTYTIRVDSFTDALTTYTLTVGQR